MKRVIFLLVLFIFSTLFVFTQERGIGLRGDQGKKLSEFYRESWALIIGINNYLYAPKLKYAISDAKAFAKLLIEKYGFKAENVIQLYDDMATRENIMRAFDRLRASDIEDRVLFFFAGHGITVPLPDGREKGYILPYDGSLSELLTTAISTDQLNEISQLIRAKHVFYIMDACYGGLIFARAKPISAEAIDYVKVISTRKSRRALTAGGRDQVVLDTGPGGHSVFTYYLIDGLENMVADLNRDGIITSGEINEYVSPRVTAESNRTQTPEYGILAGDMGGDFVFIPFEASEVLVEVFSNPAGSQVKINDEMVGVTPVNVKLKPGKYTVEISKPGYVKKVEQIEVGALADNKFSFELKELLVNLNIRSSALEGEVYVDGQFVGKLDQGRLGEVKVRPGVRIIEVKGAEEEGIASVDIPEVESAEVFIETTLKMGTLTVLSNVDDADVYINDRNYGKIKNGKFRVDLKPGSYKVELRREKYASALGIAYVFGGKEQTLPLNLEKMYFNVNINVEPSDAKVFANGEYIGSGSFTVEMKRGNVNLRVEREGYESQEKVLILDKDMDMSFELKPIVALLEIQTEPADAKIFVNGNPVGATPTTVKLPYGQNEISLIKQGYKKIDFKLNVLRTEKIKRSFKLEETIETKAMRIYTQRLGLKRNLTYTGIGLTAVSAGASVFLHMKALDAYKKYNDAVELELIRKYKEDYKKIVPWRNISIGLTAVFAGLTIYNFMRKISYDDIYQELKLKERVSLDIKALDSNYKVAMVGIKIKI
jgi:hypothetical protein